MNASDTKLPPQRGAKHDELAVFLGEWKAEGTSYGGTEQSEGDPKANGVEWTSTHTGRWHTGAFFLIQDEKARPGGEVFDTLIIMGVDGITGQFFCRTYENHGFYRYYDVTVEGKVWTFSGDHERATIEFSDDYRKQKITWEWKPDCDWLPLCDRVAVRIDQKPEKRVWD